MEPRLPEDQATARDYVAIFLVSAALMLFQVSLTRLLSVVVWYHYAFLTISMVMLGLGVPGVWFAFTARPLRFLTPLLAVAGLSMPLATVLLLRFGAQAPIWLIIVWVMPVTLSLGGVICLLLIKARGLAITRMYGVDLVGACLGAVTVIPLMSILPTPDLVAGGGLLPLAALAILVTGRARAVTYGIIVALLAVVGLSGLFEVTQTKNYDEREVRPIYENWTPTARLTVFDEDFFYLDDHEAGFTWGHGAGYPQEQRVLQYWIEQDSSAGTPITEFDGDLSRLRRLLFDVTAVGYDLCRPRRVAIVGSGGGRDVLTALVAGADEIDAIELNGAIIDIVSDEFVELSGDVYNRPGVRAVASEGRSFLTRTSKRYDLIQISLIDSWAASVAGAFALAENNLYTVEAVELYWNRLSVDGVLAVSRWYHELPRLVVLMTSAAQQIGVADPSSHLIVVAADDAGTVLLSKMPFTQEQIGRLDLILNGRGFAPVYPPGRDGHSGFPFVTQLVERGGKSATGRWFGSGAPTDDSPYFFQVISPFAFEEIDPAQAIWLQDRGVNLQSSVTLRQTMVVVSCLAMVLFFTPFVARRLSGSKWRTLPVHWRGSLYFAAIGAGFMLVENVLIQRFVLYLGHPSYATTVILASLLLGMGVGSLKSGHLGVHGLGALGIVVPLLLVVLVLLLPGLMSSTLGWKLVARIAVSVVSLAPLGLCLGVFFPLGMIRFADGSRPWFWAINGVFGVVASVMSLALSMTIGFANVGLLGAVCYAGAWLCVRGSARSA